MSDNKHPKTEQKSLVAKQTPQSNTEDKSREKPAAEKKPSAAKGATRGAKPTRSGLAFVYLLLLLIIAALAGGGVYFWDQQRRQLQAFSKQTRSLADLINQQNQALESNKALSSQHGQQLQLLIEQLNQTEQTSQQAMEIASRSLREWALAEVDYLLRIAHQRLEVARDTRGAIGALKGADKRLQDLADLNFFDIRKQLAKDIAELNAIHQVDVSGISLEIDETIKFLAELPFKSAKEEIQAQIEQMQQSQAPLSAELVTENAEPSFMDSFMDTVMKLSDTKVYHHSIKAPTTHKQQDDIAVLLRTYLLSMRLSALRYDQLQFQQDSKLALEILNLHYDTQDNRVAQLLQTLKDYQALELNPELPALNTAWSMLQEKLKQAKLPELKPKPIKPGQQNIQPDKTGGSTANKKSAQGAGQTTVQPITEGSVL